VGGGAVGAPYEPSTCPLTHPLISSHPPIPPIPPIPPRARSDCWQVDRYSNGTILADPVRFPLGVQATAEYVHSLGHGMKFGLYTAQREYTCQQRPGSWRFEAIDVDTYCRWGIDYIKTDACGGRGWEENNVTWIDFRAGINRCAHPMVLSVESCNNPSPGGCSEWIGALANLWRTTGDIQATFDSVLGNLDGNNDMAAFAGPGHWNDPVRKCCINILCPFFCPLLHSQRTPPFNSFTL